MKLAKNLAKGWRRRKTYRPAPLQLNRCIDMLLRSSINGHQKSEVSYKNWLKAEGEEEKRLVYLLRRSYTIGRQKNGVK